MEDSVSQNPADLEEVRELYTRYAISWDENRPKDLAACFTADAVFESGHGHFEGREAILENMTNLNGAMGRRKQRHVVTNVSIRLEGDRGTGTAYFIDCVGLEGKILVIACGTYHDELSRVDGRWCFSFRKGSVEGELAE
jgi:uncharacterized protein (TIGR02246 family)